MTNDEIDQEIDAALQAELARRKEDQVSKKLQEVSEAFEKKRQELFELPAGTQPVVKPRSPSLLGMQLRPDDLALQVQVLRQWMERPNQGEVFYFYLDEKLALRNALSLKTITNARGSPLLKIVKYGGLAVRKARFVDVFLWQAFRDELIEILQENGMEFIEDEVCARIEFA